MTGRSNQVWTEVWDTGRAILIAIIVALLVRQFVVKTYQVSGISMQPTLQSGERLLVNRFIYRFSAPQIGQVVVLHPPLPTSEDFVKRIVALPGETFVMRNGQVYVDGHLQPEPWEPRAWRDHFTGSRYVQGPQGNLVVDSQAIRVPAGMVWVLGDHRAVSEDSRYFGPVPITSLRGLVFLIWWPLPDFRAL